MTENLNLQKEINQKHILANLDNYYPDPKGNFVNTDFDTYGTIYYYIGKNKVSDYKVILWEMTQKILSKKEDWELTFFETDEPFPKSFKNKKIGLELQTHWFGEIENYLVGEFGYRGWHNGKKSDTGISIWGNYDNERYFIKVAWENRKNQWKSKPFSPQSQQQPEQNTKKPTSPNQTPEQPQTDEPDNQTKTKLAEAERAKQEQASQNPTPTNQKDNNPTTDNSNSPVTNDQPNNNPLPTPTEIQTHYNLDKDKVAIDNNSNLTTNQEQQQANELLKVIITAELLVKKNQFNSEILTQLLTIKNNQPSIYQLLNKENRIEQAINQLQKVEKVQRNSNSGGHNNQNQNPIPLGIMIVGSILAIVGLGILLVLRRRRSKISN